MRSIASNRNLRPEIYFSEVEDLFGYCPQRFLDFFMQFLVMTSIAFQRNCRPEIFFPTYANVMDIGIKKVAFSHFVYVITPTPKTSFRATIYCFLLLHTNM